MPIMSREKRASEAKERKNVVPAAGADDRRYTRDEIAAFLGEIAKNLVKSNNTQLHSMIALNEIIQLPYAREVLDRDLLEQARDLWLKIKSSGLQLVDPPLLFGDDVALPAEYDLSDGPAASADITDGTN